MMTKWKLKARPDVIMDPLGTRYQNRDAMMTTNGGRRTTSLAD